jgi:hypothetical protein
MKTIFEGYEDFEGYRNFWKNCGFLKNFRIFCSKINEYHPLENSSVIFDDQNNVKRLDFWAAKKLDNLGLQSPSYERSYDRFVSGMVSCVFLWLFIFS